MREIKKEKGWHFKEKLQKRIVYLEHQKHIPTINSSHVFIYTKAMQLKQIFSMCISYSVCILLGARINLSNKF